MYEAYITTIKELHKHSNADRLQCATIFGQNIIVDLSYHTGQRVIFFPVDGQLSEEYATDNNLVRKKDENGNNVGGYLDPDKRNITAVKLRGEKSEGLVMPIETLSKYVDINTLKDGDKITVLNGHEICRKYIPHNKRRRNNTPQTVKKTKQQKEKITYSYFEEHIDTEQLAYNQKAFKVGDTCYITLKMHGCFVAGTRVRMADGKSKKIEQIKDGDYVLSYDFENNKFIKSKVLHKFKNAKSENWNKIKIDRKGLPGDRRGVFTVTPNHPFWDNDKQMWIKAKDLKVGDTIPIVFPSYVLSKDQKAILVGNYLGDGYLKTQGKTASIEISCKYDKKEYLDYLVNITNGLYYLDKHDYISGYGTKMKRAKTIISADINNFFSSVCYCDNKRKDKLKDNIVNEFTELSMALLYMEDGSIVHSKNENERANIAICDYSDNDAKIIQKCLQKYNINSVLYKDPRGYNRLRINCIDADHFFALICKYVIPVMQYKLPARYQNKFEDLSYVSGFQSYIFVPQTILQNDSVKESHIEYDMETEYHNYIVGNSIVHNTSGRTSNTIKTTIKHKPYILKKLFNLKDKVTTEYETISGTRRTVLRNYDGGYYGDNQFRKKYNDFFADKLPKGMEIFYEIVGYTHDDQTIMGRCSNKLVKDKEFSKMYGEETVFSYGCDVGQNDIYVYRMTMTNPDGVVVELPWEQVQIEAEKLGVKCVPTFDKFIFTTWEDLMERVEKYYDGADPIGRTHVREGVVVRIDNREKFTAYKHKNFYFKCLEGIIKDHSDTPDIEEAEELIADDA